MLGRSRPRPASSSAVSADASSPAGRARTCPSQWACGASHPAHVGVASSCQPNYGNVLNIHILASNRRQHQLPQDALRVDTDHVTPTTSVCDLGIYVDCDVSMRTHVSRTVSSCFAVLRQLRSIRRIVSPAVLQLLVVSLVLSRLDYGNATHAGLPGNQLDRLQSVINDAA